MKKLLLLACFLVALIGTSYSQAPAMFNYQAVARNTSGAVIANQQVGLKISIRDGGPQGNIVYQELHDSVPTNSFGIITIVVGGGIIMQGDMNTINWASASKFMQVEFDAANNGNFVNMGTTQLLSVPYSMYAQTSGSSLPGPTGPQGAQGIQGMQGITGAQGLQGPTGNDGAQGIAGPMGPTGPQGIQGPTGNDGPQGAQGADGPIGPTGPQGIQGPIGNDGPQGAQGIDGPTGPQGLQGPTGIQGIQGVAGATGQQGIAGPTGLQGSTGAQGIAGPTGPQGVTGAQGITGPVVQGTRLGSTLRWTTGGWSEDTSSISNAVGIGVNTSTPNAELQVNSTTATSRISITSAASGTGLTDGLKMGITGSNDAYLVNNESGNLILGSGAAERVRITSTGQLSIMDNTPDANLDVNGNFALGSNGTVLNHIIKASVTFTIPSLTSNSGQTFAVTIPGVVSSATGTVMVSPVNALNTPVVIAWARVSNDDEVEIRFQNYAGGNSTAQSNTEFIVTVVQ
jgi:hypothetical protein